MLEHVVTFLAVTTPTEISPLVRLCVFCTYDYLWNFFLRTGV